MIEDILALADSADWKDDLPGEPTQGNLNKRIALRRALSEYEQRKRSLRQQQKKEYDPCTIAGNLQALMKSQQLSIRETVAATSADGKCEPKEIRWLKRVAAEGIVQTDKRSMARLGRLADFFGVTVEQLRSSDLAQMADYQEFNRPDTPGFRRYACMLEELLADNVYDCIETVLMFLYLGTGSQGIDETEAKHVLDVMTAEISGDNKRQQRCICMLSRLLRTGKHDYLKDLITEFYGIASREWAAKYQQSAKSASDVDKRAT
jgi:hypothetical protein